MVLGPIMGFSLPVSRWLSEHPRTNGPSLKIVSCNVQDFEPDFSSVLAEVGKLNPDIVAFQDTSIGSKLFVRYFESWHSIHSGEFFVASRYPVKLLTVGHFDAFDRDAIVKCEIELPTTKVILFNLHQMTPRHGLRALDLSSPITQHGSDRLTRYLELRAEEAAAVRNFVNESIDDTPTIIVGDFNMPYESSLYQRNWLGFQNAFNTAGTGYGFTFPCTRQYRWPAGMPWIRLDHILTDSSWTIQSCTVGATNGSDHRLIAATLSLP
jgi:endonuclease/exonuclease/phosphatase (EEP) superfamily protein YafD